MSILDIFLKIEDDIKLCHYTFVYKNILMYPFIRNTLLQNALENMQNVSSFSSPSHAGIIKKINYWIKSFLYKPSKYIKSDIIFFGSDIANIPLEKGYFNRLTEVFANEYPAKTILIEKPDQLEYKRPRTYSRVFARDFLVIIAGIKRKIKREKTKDLEQICSFLEYLKQHFHLDNNTWDNLKNTLFNFARLLPFLYQEYEKIIKCISPKIIFIEDACYGGDKIPLMIAAKNLGIPVGEYQHGMLSLAHTAYNYSPQLPEIYKFYMPDFFMSWGKYWSQNSRMPINVFDIGNPYLSNSISQKKHIQKKEQILYISSTIDPEKYVEEVIWLNTNLCNKGYSIIFRIHPSETSRLQTVYKRITDNCIPIDSQPLYKSLETTKYLIGDFSTVIFEATMFDCIVFIRDTLFNRGNIDVSIFNLFYSKEDFIEKITSMNYKKTDPDIFFTGNWREKYHKLIDSYINN